MDDKRANFVGIQHGSGIAAIGYEVPPLRTGFEKVIAHRTDEGHANPAEADGVVKALDENILTITYGKGDKAYDKSYFIGRRFGRLEGGVYPHDVVANVKVGDKVKEGDILAYNKNFFQPDIFNPKQVNWMAGVMANIVLLEGTDTLEDTSVITKSLSDKLSAFTTKVKCVTIRFDQAVHELVKVGDELTTESILCTIEDSLTATTDEFSKDSLSTLKGISAMAPRAKVNGVVDKIEVFYNGEMEDMSPSILAVARNGDRTRKKESAHSPTKLAITGKVNSSLRIEGKPVELDTIVVRIYITHLSPAIGGDKGVFANQMKTTFRRVAYGTNETFSGIKLDGIFGKKSVDDRIVQSIYQIGTVGTLSKLAAAECRKIIAEMG